MKQFLVLCLICSSFFLLGCDEENVLSTTTENMNAKTAIENYLASADLKGEGAEIQKGDNVTVDYIGRLNDSEVFDTSVESIAKVAGVYSEGRNYEEGLTFDVGAGQMIAGFDEGVIGMKVGQTKTVTIPADQAYGQRREDMVMEFDLAELPGAENFQEGQEVYLNYGMSAIITKKTDKKITLDMNHKLAGKDLIFDITIKSINKTN